VLRNAGLYAAAYEIIPDDFDMIKARLVHFADELKLHLILTTGGTGFSPRDITPEATKAVIEREAPGVCEAIRLHSLSITNRAMLSRAVCGIRAGSVILNLPGSPKAVAESLEYALDALLHGLDILTENTHDCARKDMDKLHNNCGEVVSINISVRKGVVKTPVESAILTEGIGISGDAHAEPGIRQLSLLANESINKMRSQTSNELNSGDFAENITTSGLELHKLPIGTKMSIGEALIEVSKIGKECHHGCAIQQKVGKCIMPLEGIFAIILRGGTVRRRDKINVLE